MLCEKCNQQTATVHLQQIVNGEKIESYICQACAQQIDGSISFDNMLQGFLNSFFAMPEIAVKIGHQNENDVLACPECSLSYHDFKKTGKIGCGQCYQTFRKEMDTVLKNIQGSNHHEGKIPLKAGAGFMKKRELENIKVELHKAVELEEFEQAAHLRDRIRELERGITNGEMV